MSLKNLLAAALASASAAEKLVFDASLQTEGAYNRLRDLQEYIDAAPKSVDEIIKQCAPEPTLVYYGRSKGGFKYLLSRAELDSLLLTTFSAGCISVKAGNNTSVNNNKYTAAGVKDREVGKSPTLGLGYAQDQCKAEENTAVGGPFTGFAQQESLTGASCDETPNAVPEPTSVEMFFPDGSSVELLVRK